MSVDDEPVEGMANLGISLAMDDAIEGSEVDPSARRLIDKQAHLLDLQMKAIAGQIRQANVKNLRERLHVAFELLLAVALAASVLGVITLVIQASLARGVIIQPLASPPDLDQRGLTGAVVASRLLDRIGEIRDATSSVRAGAAARKWRPEDIKVEIPNTGVSLTEANRLLRGWLGHEVAVTGELFHDRGQLSLAVRLGEHPAVTVTGGEDQIDSLIQRAAESVMAQTEPYRYAVYLSTQGRRDEAMAAARRLSAAASAEDRAWGFAMWGRLLASQGDFNGALAMGRRSLQLDASLSATHDNLAAAERFLGHDQEAEQESAKAFDLMQRQRRDLDPATGPVRLATAQGRAMEGSGDYGKAADAYHRAINFAGADRAGVATASLPRVLARQHDIYGAQQALRELPPSPPEDAAADAGVALSQVALAMQDWPQAIAALQAADATAGRFGPAGEQFRRVFVWPDLAFALARSGQTAAAEAVVAKMPSDAYPCARAAAIVAALAGNRGLAERRFQTAVALAPDLPAAYLDWGRTRLAYGDAKGAEALFVKAGVKGAGWADVQLAWGEALAAQGQGAGALEHYRKAVAQAPAWSLAHQRLGELLAKMGRTSEAVVHLTRAKVLFRPADEAAAFGPGPDQASPGKLSPARPSPPVLTASPPR